MKNNIEVIKQQIDSFEINSAEELEAFRLQFMVRKGSIAELFNQLKGLSPADRPEYGQRLNQLKKHADRTYEEAEKKLNTISSDRDKQHRDLTLPGRKQYTGSEHPVQQVLGDMKQIFRAMGFTIATGPELEIDSYNFDKLNFPSNHPARDMQDTFFIRKNGKDEDLLLRTHTSLSLIHI